jgi:site-specific DNA recombinase
MKSCFGYVRVSTVKQGEGVSLEAQREAILAYAGRSNIEIVEWFAEKETAAKSGRPIFSAMIKALRRGNADGLVMHKIDRSARNFADWAKIGELSDDGIDVHFATETLDFRSRGGRLSADIQAVIAADYIRNLREETIKGIVGRLKQGLYPFKAPIGYLDNGGGKAKTPDPVRAPFIEQAFELYASSEYSLRSLQRELERRGLRSFQGRPVSKGGLETMLSNTFYCGIITIKRTGAVYEGVHEKLISPGLFERVQLVRVGKTTTKRDTKHKYTYRGLFHCGLCKTAMIPEYQKRHIYYRCQTSDCPTKCMREEVLEQSIFEALHSKGFDEAEMATFRVDMKVWFQERAKQDTAQPIKLQLGNLKERQERLTDALIDRLIDQDAFNKRNRVLLMEKAALEESIEKSRRQEGDGAHIEKFLELVKSLCSLFFLAKPDEKREIAKMATSNRYVEAKNLLIEPSNWLVLVNDMLIDLFGAPDHPVSRSTPELRNQHFETLCEIARSKEVLEMEAFLDQSRHVGTDSLP